MQRSGVDSGLQESHWNLRFPPPTVEPVDELVNIFLHVLVRHTMNGSEQKRFQITDHHMHLRQPVGGILRWRHFRVMFMAFGNHPQSCERVGSDNRICTEVRAQLPHRPEINMIHHVGVHEADGVAVVLHGKQRRFAPFGPCSRFPGCFPPDIGVIKLDQSVQQTAIGQQTPAQGHAAHTAAGTQTS